jgi:nucleoside phosphorylase
MSSGAFDRFAEAAEPALQGEAAVAAFLGFLRARGPDDRFDASLIGDIVEVDPRRVKRLIDLSVSEDFGLLERETLIECPGCERSMRRSHAEADLASEETVDCQGCGSSFADLSSWKETEIFRLSPVALADSYYAAPTLRAVVVTALLLEFEAVCAHLENLHEERDRGTIYTVGKFQGLHAEWHVAVVIGEAGGINAAAAAERAITNFDPDLALFVGVAGGLAEQGMAWGKVVAATEVSNYEWGVERNDFHLRPMSWRTSYALRQRALQVQSAAEWPRRAKAELLEGMEFAAVVQPIAAGDKLVRETESDTYQRVREKLDRAVAVEMEGHGFLAALDQNEQVSGIIVRGISDLCFDKDEAGRAGTQPVAAANAAAFAFELLAQYQPS